MEWDSNVGWNEHETALKIRARRVHPRACGRDGVGAGQAGEALPLSGEGGRGPKGAHQREERRKIKMPLLRKEENDIFEARKELINVKKETRKR